MLPDYRAMKRLFPVIGIALVSACDPRSADSTSAPDAWCADSVEAKALACSQRTARRSGDTLFLRLDSGRDTAITNVIGEEDVNYKYLGRIGRKHAHLIEQFGGDHPPRFFVMNSRTGNWITARGMPVMSPDAERFAAANDEWDCAEAPDQRLEVWRFSDSVPIREWKLETLRCEADGTTAGWAAVTPRWRAADTLEFMRLERPASAPAESARGDSYVRRPAVAANGRDGWRMISPP
jgi:hypothetical protein